MQHGSPILVEQQALQALGRAVGQLSVPAFNPPGGCTGDQCREVLWDAGLPGSPWIHISHSAWCWHCRCTLVSPDGQCCAALRGGWLLWGL